MTTADSGADFERILRGSPGRLSVTFYDDEDAVDVGPVAVTATGPAGAVILSGVIAESDNAGTYAVTLPAQDNLGRLEVTWTSATRTATTFAEIAGGFYFSLAAARASDASLSSPDKYPTARLKRGRVEVEDEFERMCGVAFVPRYARAVFTRNIGDRVDYLLRPAPRRILALTVDGVPQELPYLAGLRLDPYGALSGIQKGGSLVLEYEHGFDAPPPDLRRAALTRLRYNLLSDHGGVPDRATGFTSAEGGTYTLATAGRAGYHTGIPEVDEVLDAYSYRIPGVA